MNTLPANIRSLLDQLMEKFRRVLDDNLVGIYLHGSLAMGGFNPRMSDVDFIVVVNEKLSTEVKRAIIALAYELAQDAPQKGLEFSVVLLDATRHFVHPSPFELHSSISPHDSQPSTHPDYETQRVDPDLAAHFTIIRKRGVCLYGKPIDEVFGDVPETDYWDSIRGDAEDIQTYIAENPVYGVLNLCRVLAYKQERLILSKVEGGHWGLAHLDPQFHALIQQALNAYVANDSTRGDWDTEGLQGFAANIKALL